MNGEREFFGRTIMAPALAVFTERLQRDAASPCSPATSDPMVARLLPDVLLTAGAVCLLVGVEQMLGAAAAYVLGGTAAIAVAFSIAKWTHKR
jgi:hypothetical protein